MVEVDRGSSTLLHDVVRTFALHLTNEADATRVVLELWIIEALFRGESVISHFCVQKGAAFRRMQRSKSTSILPAKPSLYFGLVQTWFRPRQPARSALHLSGPRPLKQPHGTSHDSWQRQFGELRRRSRPSAPRFCWTPDSAPSRSACASTPAVSRSTCSMASCSPTSIRTTPAASRCLSRKRSVPLFCTALTQETLAGSLGFRKPPSWRLMTTGSAFEFQDLRIESFPVPHDAVDPSDL
jgi:hypothetical protein